MKTQTSHDQYFHDQIRRQTSLEAASLTLAECAESLGWDLAAFHVDKDANCLPRCRDGDFIAHAMGWPTDCLQGWVRRGFGRHCPAGIASGRRSDPFAWLCEDDAWFDGEMLPQQREVMDYYGRYIAGGV
ncbi:MAG: LuxR family transcriptional regulator, partial [Gammaproteobacteria bacterium]